MPNHAIKTFFDDSRCPICKRQIKGWARVQCDNCGRTCCRRHRPLFVGRWQCSICDEAQQAFQPAFPDPQQQQQPQGQAPQNYASAESFFEALRTAEELLSSNPEQAERIAQNAVVDLYKDE